MPCWSDIMEKVSSMPQNDVPQYLVNESVGYLKKIENISGRNVIAYYSGWLKNNGKDASIVETDKNAFMNAIYQMDRSKGLDLILHTPGGDIAVTESIVSYLKSIFGHNVRAIIPQLSMSAGTLIAMSCKEIVMGKQSSLGPIDPQINGIACQMVIDEFYQAANEVKQNPASLGLWQTIISKYSPTYLTVCKDAVKWSDELATAWLKEVDPNINIDKIKDVFINHKHSYSHSRHFSSEDCKKAGLKIKDLEDNQTLQDAVLSLHHCLMILIDKVAITKIVLNQLGRNYIQLLQNKSNH